MKITGIAAMAAACLGNAAIAAEPAKALPAGTVSASSIDSVVNGLHEAGYKAAIKKNDKGETYVASGANGNEFTITFMNCDDNDKKIGCETLLFSSWYTSKPYITESIANQYNREETFGRTYIDDKDELILELPVTTVGGINLENFKDIVDWWSVCDADLGKLVDKALAASKKPGKSA